jgi:sigma-B regulation protein RsbU (phosphoserine phosphatase)
MPLRYNKYNTTDARELLLLKQQEDQALLHVVRLIEPNIDPEELIFIVVNTLQRQLDVHKVLFATAPEAPDDNPEPRVVVNIGLPHPTPEALAALPRITRILNVATSPFESLKEMGVEYVVPLGNEERLSAWFLIADFAETEEETLNDLMFIETIGNILAISLENIRLFERKMQAERVQQELELAGRIQRQSLPERFDLLPQLEIFARNISHSSVGGDFFNLIQTGPNELYYFIADAAGKGTAAAILITNVTANLNAMIKTGASFEQMIHQLHDVIGHLTGYEAFATIFLGRIDVAEQVMEYVNAGHNPPVFSTQGRQRELSEGCIPLGIMPVDAVEVGRVPFRPGDSVFLYTDGMVEQQNREGELFGDHRVRAFVANTLQHTSSAVVKLALREVQHFAEGLDYEDDITIMNIRYRTT